MKSGASVTTTAAHVAEAFSLALAKGRGEMLLAAAPRVDA